VQIKLDELNKILDEMKQGEEAVKKLTEMDQSMGMQDPLQVAKRLRGDQRPAPAGSDAALNAALDDTGIAANLRQQAERMQREAKGLLAEVDRLLQEAAVLDPVKAVKAPRTAKAPKTEVVQEAPKARKSRAKVTA
jgi:hypothetical protein